ncbi:gamma-glutamyltransferase family protein [Synechococcus sp. Nb3U1]|uniref:gamma-glutamyltransferase family protein n=1 Tax=Synechococcus sp. Nb3U1 TaxID=1914529 RepID=UPI001F484254|nr:gamma-glutamyltransferase family protein [Synechococcus sp. Nb3U1]MCF2970000.1 gamma-glutamyltransferase family protein [Synechococcus sp. Nb3U1]
MTSAFLGQDLSHYPFTSQRRVVMGRRGAVATSQPLAAMAGMELFWAGGNAVDAALAMAIALTVVEPTSNGIGSDAFALVWDGAHRLHGLNASGRSPAALTPQHFTGYERIPPLGWLTVTIPGAVSAWQALHRRWGRLPFERLFEPAIRLAQEGFPVSPRIAQLWQAAEKTYLPLQDPCHQPFLEVFFPQGRAPRAGEIWGSPRHAQTLETLARTGGESFYRGELAQKLLAFSESTGGILSPSDLQTHQADWVEPICTHYRGYTVWEMPPNGQGIAALMALNLLEGFELSRIPYHSSERYHLQIEAMKLAFADVHRQVADPDYLQVSPAQMLDKGYAEQRRGLIRSEAIPVAQPGLPQGGTVYLAAVDGDLMVSFIQSNFDGFGSGLLVPGTGIALHNRGTGFTLESGHPNQVGPRKRPYHTIIPAFLSKDGIPLGPFGVMGGAMQPQGHVQVVVNRVDYGLNPQAALDAPRWRYLQGNQVVVEATVPESVVQELAARGHQVRVMLTEDYYGFGRGQIIFRAGDALISASEPRADGLALAW